MVSAVSLTDYSLPMITGPQIRAARGLVGWKQTDLAERAGVAVPTIQNIELGKSGGYASTMAKIEEAFRKGGVIFMDANVNREGGAGVRYDR